MARKSHLFPMGKIRKLKKSTSKHFRKTTPNCLLKEVRMLRELSNEAGLDTLESQQVSKNGKKEIQRRGMERY